MTSRSTFLIFALLLLIASLAGAAEMSQAAPPVAAPAGTPAFMAPAATSPGCAKAELPFLAPKPSQASAGGEPCGSCSDPQCRGSVTGYLCILPGPIYYGTCRSAGYECTANPVTWHCTCWNGPVPL